MMYYQGCSHVQKIGARWTYYQGCSHVQKIGARTPATYNQRQTCQLTANSRVQLVLLIDQQGGC